MGTTSQGYRLGFMGRQPTGGSEGRQLLWEGSFFGRFLSPGWSFGIGFTVKTEAGMDGMPSSVGEYNWIGIQGTSFWVDPEEDLVGVFMVQIRPNRDITFREQFKRLVYQALIG